MWPIDGTSAVSRKIDEVFGSDNPGRIMVMPSGDEGSIPNHSRATYTNTAPAEIGISRASTTTSVMSAWNTGSQPASITVTFDNSTSVGPVAPGSFLDQDGVYIINYLPGAEFYPWQSTSGSAPIVVGAVALMLQVNPNLTAEDARQILRANAVSDVHTGAVPNNDWGCGKLDIYASVLDAAFTMNASLNNAWVSANAPYQGMFVTVFPGLKLVFVAWFTFDSVIPNSGTATFGASDHRWVTAAGAFSGGKATLNAERPPAARSTPTRPCPPRIPITAPSSSSSRIAQRGR